MDTEYIENSNLYKEDMSQSQAVRLIDEEYIELKNRVVKLESEYDEMHKSQHDLFIDLCKYKKALDKACEAIVWFTNVQRNCEVTACENCKYTNSGYCMANDKNDWKEWCLKDE